ncbi:unnamed protein product [Cylicocyclus nassatus]|uniref:Uncharacterized protein n=1 Tax=Cylicocyclus nassatus TaxID=53992 RepID=A0AA36MAG4_CYLNA|nr:unnamed protein product [Cylicocyclus nassatus]
MKLTRENADMGEDTACLRTLISITTGRRSGNYLEEILLFEEQILSMLVSGEVKKTIFKIQSDQTVLLEVQSIFGHTSQCSLHDCSGYLFKAWSGDGERKADRATVCLQFGDLYVIKYGCKTPVGKSFDETLRRGATSSVNIKNVAGGKKLMR